HFVVNGQKVWTSGAHFADWCFLLVRTDPDAPKHHGISYLLVDMKTPGVTVRPLVLLNGHRHFNEVFFEDVVVPKENLVGPLNEGWKVTTTTLMFERGGAGGRDHAAQIARLLELAKQFPNRQEPAFRERPAPAGLGIASPVQGGARSARRDRARRRRHARTSRL